MCIEVFKRHRPVSQCTYDASMLSFLQYYNIDLVEECAQRDTPEINPSTLSRCGTRMYVRMYVYQGIQKASFSINGTHGIILVRSGIQSRPDEVQFKMGV